MFNNENLTCKHILPFSNCSLAPVTNQCPGLSCGPLHNCDISINFRSFCACTDTGGPVGNTPESTTTAGCFSFNGLPEIEVLIAEKRLDFWENPEDTCVQLDCTMKASDTLENKSLRWRTFFESCFFTRSWAPVTIKATSSLEVQPGLYLTGAVLIWENFFLCIASKYRPSAISSDPRHIDVSSILLSSIIGVFDRCCKCMANLRYRSFLININYGITKFFITAKLVSYYWFSYKIITILSFIIKKVIIFNFCENWYNLLLSYWEGKWISS